MHHAMFFIFLAAIIPQDRPEMRSLVEAERAFAAASVEKGAREAFTANFADDGIAFQPHPVVYKEAMKNRPLPANPKAFTLDWKPVFGDVSESGDLGYTTGPYSLVDNSGKQPTRYGFYFSVWKKVSGQWQVAVDIGIRTPTNYEGALDFRQAQSWGKIARDARSVSLYSDATIALPIIATGVADNFNTKKRRMPKFIIKEDLKMTL